MRLLCAATLSVLGACSGHALPPQETLLSYPGTDLASAQGQATDSCAAYSQKPVLVGTQTAADGSKVVTFKCQ